MLSDRGLFVRKNSVWSAVTPQELPASAIVSAKFLDVQHGWAVVTMPPLGSLGVATTTDGGQSWTLARIPIWHSPEIHYREVEIGVADAQHVWLLVRKPTGKAFSVAHLFSSSDGGRHWEALPQPPAYGRLQLLSPTDGWLAGSAGIDRMWRTRDAGKHWQEASLPAGGGALRDAPVFTGARGAVLIGTPYADRDLDAVYVTEDGGMTWVHSETVDRGILAIDRTNAKQLRVDPPHGSRWARRTDTAGTNQDRGWSASQSDFVRPGDGWVYERSVQCELMAATCEDEQFLWQFDGDWKDVLPPEERLEVFVRPALWPEATAYSNGDAFDTAAQSQLSVSQMSNLLGSAFSVNGYTGTYRNMGVYIGGASVGATPPTTSWLQQVSNQGWGFLPLWVPSQAPCTTFRARLNYADDPVAKGNAEGNQAVAAARNYGFPAGSIIWVDIEAFVNVAIFPNCTSADQTIMKRFVHRIFAQLRAGGYTAGLYTSATNGRFWTTTDANLTTAPDALWLAAWGRSRFEMGSYMTAGWYQGRRAHQFTNKETNAIGTLGADYDAVDAQVSSVGSQATVTINSASASPQTTGTASTFTIQYAVNASAATAVMLGASLRLHGTTSWSINDPPRDTTVSLSSGTNNVSRQFTVSAAAGVYDLLVAVWRDQNANGAIDGADQQLHSLTVLNAVTLSPGSSCKSLTLLRNPNAGGTIDATPTATIPCNIGYYLTSTPISLVARPSSGYQFTGWTGSGGSFSSQSQTTTTFTITDNAQVTATFSATPQSCSYSLSTTATTGSSSGGSGSLQITGSPNGCTGSWSASPSSSGNWLSLTGTASGSGSGAWPVAYAYASNPSTTATRTGTITFTGAFPSGGTFTLTQSAASTPACGYSFNPPSATGVAAGGTGTVQISGSPNGCTGNWSASPSSSGGWLTLTGTTSGAGAGSWPVAYSFTANPGTSTRAGSITFTGSLAGTFTLTQDGTGSGSGSDLIVNGGFEFATTTGNAALGWNVYPSLGSGHQLIVKNGPFPHGGTNYAILGGSDGTEYDWLIQTLTIPADATSATLTFWVSMTTEESPGASAYDYLWALLYDANDALIVTPAELSNQNAPASNNTLGQYFKVGPVDLTAYRGMPIDLALVAYTDGSLPTTFVIDDVSLQINGVSDQSPTTSITSPADGATVAGIVNVTATASDDHGVTSLEILIDGVASASNSNATSLTHVWTTTSLQNGPHTLAARARDAAGHVATSNAITVTVANLVLAAPVNLLATAASPTQVNLVWSPVTGAAGYQVLRSTNGSPWAVVGSPGPASYADNGVSPNISYLYQVRAVSASNSLGLLSNTDLATTIVFTNDPVVPGATPAKSAHLLELRIAVNAVRAIGGLTSLSFAGPIASGTRISATQIVELRAGLDAARAQLGLPALVYTDPVLTAGTRIKAAHVNELRMGMK